MIESVYTEGDTAHQFIEKTIERIKSGGESPDTITLMEFSRESSFDAYGEPVQIPKMSLSRASSLSLLKEGGDKPSGMWDRTAHKIEMQLGIPFIIFPNIRLDKVTLKTKDDITASISIFERKKKTQIKRLQEMCPDINDTLCIKTLTALEILSWIKNNLDAEKIINRLKQEIIRRERDKLFYIRRHPGEVSLHRCHDSKILETIKHLRWAIGCNPFGMNGGRHGKGNYAL